MNWWAICLGSYGIGGLMSVLLWHKEIMTGEDELDQEFQESTGLRYFSYAGILIVWPYYLVLAGLDFVKLKLRKG